MRLLLLAVVSLLALPASANPRTPSPPGAEVYFIAPVDGARVKSPVTVRFGLKGMGIAPAGIKFENTGHHHLLLDVDVPKDLTVPLPATAQIVHFGKGQTETTIELKPGKHTLQLVLGDLLHIPHDPPLISPQITITVVK
jgi:hypothetical protein